LVSDGVVNQSDAQAQTCNYAKAFRRASRVHAVQERRFGAHLRDAGVPDAGRSHRQRRLSDFEVCWYGHIGDGNLHLNILKPATLSIDDFFAKCHHISRASSKSSRRTTAAFPPNGVGLLKRDFLGYSRSADEIAAMRALKAVFDPRGSESGKVAQFGSGRRRLIGARGTLEPSLGARPGPSMAPDAPCTDQPPPSTFGTRRLRS
jgi:hypothetical protein